MDLPKLAPPNRPVAAPSPLTPPQPRLRDGLAVFALDGGRVRIGLADPVVIDGLTTDEAAFVARLEGPPPRASIDGTPYAHVTRTLARLGLLGDPEPTGAAAHSTRGGDASVCVMGANELGIAVGLCLAQTGLCRVLFDDDAPVATAGPLARTASATRAQAAVRTVNDWVPQSARVAAPGGTFGPADIAVVVANGSPPVTLVHDLMAADQAHLPVISDERGVTVGPVVLPGQGPCLTCMGIARTELDPDWPEVSLQCAGTRAPYAPATVRALAAGVACDAVARYLSGRRADARQWRVECVSAGASRTGLGQSARAASTSPSPSPAALLRGGPILSERLVSKHRACRCGDELMLGDDLEDHQAILF